MTHPRRRGVTQSPYGPHEALVGAIPTGPAPANPTRQRLGTTLACTCGADWGLVSELPRHDGGRRAAMRRYAEHTELAALVVELRALSTADRLVDASAVPGPTSRWCCDRPAVVFVAFDEPCGLSTRHWERDLCVECAREVISRTRADYVDVEVRIPAVAP